jgi:hypothetical protein
LAVTLLLERSKKLAESVGKSAASGCATTEQATESFEAAAGSPRQSAQDITQSASRLLRLSVGIRLRRVSKAFLLNISRI